jgi:cytoskeleton protein RodZ
LLGAGYWYSGYRTEHARDAAVANRPAETAGVTQAPIADTAEQSAAADKAVASIPVASEPVQANPSAVTPSAVATPADGITFLGVKDAWVEVRAPDGSRLFYDHVRAGELRNVRGEGPWRVYVSDTEAVEVRLGAHVVDVPASKRTGAEARFGLKSDGTIL